MRTRTDRGVESAWLTPYVIDVADTIYGERRFSDLPFLADALEEAGSDNGDLLNHARQHGVPVKGCWLLDALLGKGCSDERGRLGRLR